MAGDESQKQESGKKVSFRVIDGHLSSQEFGAVTCVKSIKEGSYSEVTL